jgi:hypothetical protein
MSISVAIHKGSRNFIEKGIAFLQHFFSRKDVSVICFILAICIKILLTWSFLKVHDDKLYQALAGKNLIEGHGLTLKQVHVSNLSKEYYESLVGWPPGYSVVFGIIYKFVNDVDVSCFIIDIIFIVLYFIILRKLLKQLDFPVYLINVFVLFNGSSITNYIIHSTPTDLITLVLSLHIFYFSIRVFKNEKDVAEVALLAILNVIPAWFRYMYIPITFVIPAFFIWNGWMKKNKRLLLHGIIILAAGIISTIVLLGIQKPYGTQVGYIVVSDRGVFWSNLLQLYPVLITAFINIDFYLSQLSSFTGITYSSWMQIMRWINMILFIFLLSRFLLFSFRRKWLVSTTWQAFITAGGITAFSIFCVLAYMSVTYNGYFPPPRKVFWTYLSEERYFIFLEFVIVIISVRWLFIVRSAPLQLKKLLQWLFLLAFCIEFMHCFYFLGKNFTFGRKTNHPLLNYMDEVIKENKKKNIDVVFAASPNLASLSVLSGGKALLESNELNDKIYSGKPVKLVAIFKGRPSSFYNAFFENQKVTEEVQFGPLILYSCYINPDTTNHKY